MKLKFKKQAYQTCAVEAVVDCFRSQPNTVGISYRLGERRNIPITVHQTNVLTVVACASYKNFVIALQKDINKSLPECSRVAHVKYFTSKIMQTDKEYIF